MAAWLAGWLGDVLVMWSSLKQQGNEAKQRARQSPSSINSPDSCALHNCISLCAKKITITAASGSMQFN